MTYGIEYLGMDVDLDTIEALLTVDDRIVAIQTLGVELLYVAVPAVVPDHRYIVVADSDDGIHERMNAELQYGGTVTSLRRTCVVRVRARRTIGVPEEVVGMTFEYRLTDHIVVRLVDGQDEGNDTVATVSCGERIAVDTLLVVGVALEVVARTLTHRMTYGIELRLVNYQLQAVEHAFAVQVGRVVAVDAGRVERSSRAVPLVDPHIGQVVGADGHDGIYQLVYDELEYRRTVATLRRSTIVVVGAGGLAYGVEELYLLSLEDMLNAVVVVRLVDGQYERRDAIATVGSTYGVAVDATLGECYAAEGVTASLANSSAYGVELRLVDDELQREERALTVDIGRIVAVDTGLIQRLGLATPSVGHRVRQLVLTDDDGGVDLRVNGQEELGDRVTTLGCLTIVAIGAGGGVVHAVERIVLALVDVGRNTQVNRLIDGQYQRDDTVASMHRYQGVGVGTCLGITLAVEQVVRTLAHSVANRVVDDRQHLYIAHVGTVVTVVGLEVLDVFARLVDVLFVVPGVRRLVRADGHGIAEEVCGMYTQTQAVDTVASVAALEVIYILTCRIERIAV